MFPERSVSGRWFPSLRVVPLAPPHSWAPAPLLSATQCKHSVPEECWTPWPPLQFTRFSLAALCSSISSSSSSPPPPLPVSPSAPPPEPLHSTLSVSPRLASAPSPRLASPPLLLPPPFFLTPFFFFPVLVPHHRRDHHHHHHHHHPQPLFPFSPFFLSSSPRTRLSFTSQPFHSVAVDCVSFLSSLCLVHFTHLIDTSESKLTWFGLKTCSSGETTGYRHGNMQWV